MTDIDFDRITPEDEGWQTAFRQMLASYLLQTVQLMREIETGDPRLPAVKEVHAWLRANLISAGVEPEDAADYPGYDPADARKAIDGMVRRKYLLRSRH